MYNVCNCFSLVGIYQCWICGESLHIVKSELFTAQGCHVSDRTEGPCRPHPTTSSTVVCGVRGTTPIFFKRDLVSEWQSQSKFFAVYQAQVQQQRTSAPFQQGHNGRLYISIVVLGLDVGIYGSLFCSASCNQQTGISHSVYYIRTGEKASLLMVSRAHCNWSCYLQPHLLTSI